MIEYFSSHDNLGEKDHDCKGFDDQSGLKSEARDDATEQHIEPRALNLTRADSTASSLDEGHSKTEQHKLAAMILGKVFKASDSFHNLAKQSFAGSTRYKHFAFFHLFHWVFVSKRFDCVLHTI